MWDDFTDYELASLCASYGLEDELIFNERLQLSNRTHIEKLLAKFEMNLAFPVDINEELV